MKMKAEKRAIDKIFKRRDRYDIPDWQRGKVWDKAKKQQLIDSILRGWKLPKFYFVQVGDDSFLVEDGQQRLAAIFDFFSNSLALTEESSAEFGGPYYRNLKHSVSDLFDDFEIEYDVIEDGSDEDLKEFFQRLQAGMALNSSEKLNAVHSKLRDFCLKQSKHSFFSDSAGFPDTRYAYFDIVTKVICLEIEGLDASLRFEDVKKVFEAHANFSASSAVAKRVSKALDFLQATLRGAHLNLRSRTVVQSLLTLTCKLVSTGRETERASEYKTYLKAFMKELAEQVELGQSAVDSDYLTFQQSINANVRGSAKIRQQVLLRKLFRLSPELAGTFDPTMVLETGVTGRISDLATSLQRLVTQINEKHSVGNGEDLFKPTNKTVDAMSRLSKAITSIGDYGKFIDDLYFLFREGPGSKLADDWPKSFVDVNSLRTSLRHDVDHGDAGKVRAKRLKVGNTFAEYAGTGTIETIDPSRLPLFQANLLGAIEGDLRILLLRS